MRTVYRDMESLSAAGVPLYGDAGHDGGYRLLDGFRTRLTGLTAAEGDSLFLTGLPTAAADLGMGAFAAAVRLKLMASLPPSSATAPIAALNGSTSTHRPGTASRTVRRT